MHYFFKNLLHHSRPWIRQTEYIHAVKMNKEGSDIINFNEPSAVVPERGYSVYMSYGENALILFLFKSSFLLPGMNQTN